MGSRARAFLIAMTLATSALADPTPQEKETARNLMDEGRELRDDKKDLKAALQRFTAADQIMKVPTTGFEVASTQAQLGQLVEARETLARVISSQPKPGEPPQFKEARNKAQSLDDALAGRIATLVVSLNHSPPGVVVTIDGITLPATLIGLPARANPGHHVVVANAKTEEGRQEIDLREGERKEITLELASRGVDHETIARETPAAPVTHGGGARTAGLVTLGIAGAALVTGGVTGVLATAGIVMVIVGKPSAAKEEHARVVPWIGPGSAGLRGTF